MPDGVKTHKWRIVVFVAALLAFAVFVILRWSKFTGPPASHDAIAAATANARGVGHMEQFDYPAAAAAFTEALARAPDWPPAKVNLGIALFNTQQPADLDRALQLFAEVIAADPNNAHAHFCSGIIRLHRNDLEAAHAHFSKVCEIDPADGHAVFYRGKTRPDEPSNPASKADYVAALALNPYLNAARYSAAQHPHEWNEAKSRALLAEFDQFRNANWEDELEIKYTAMGRYAEVIGKSPTPHPTGGPVPLFEATTTPLPPAALAADPFVAAIRARFGQVVVVFDYDGDGKPDLYLPGHGDADMLLRNTGGGTFADATAASGLGKLRGGYAAAAGDFDNDGRPDLAVCGTAGLILYRNTAGTFEDKTGTVPQKVVGDFDPLARADTVSAQWLDVDQDGDLDLIVTSSARVNGVRAPKPVLFGCGVLLNVGVAPPSDDPDRTPPLSAAFRWQDWPGPSPLGPPALAPPVLLDIDADKDVDLLALADGQRPIPVLNDRLSRFRAAAAAMPGGPGVWLGGLAIDANGDDQSDLVLLAENESPRILVSKVDVPGDAFSTRFAAGTTDSRPLVQASRCDLDLDGRADVLGRTAAGEVVYLRGDGAGKFARVPDAFGPNAGTAAAAVADFDGDGKPDVVAVGPGGVRVFKNMGNGNNSVRVRLTGKRDFRDAGKQGKNQRTNADGIGSRAFAHAGPLRAMIEFTTLEAGLGRSLLPLHFGIGKASAADAVRVRWPDLVTQAELNVPAEGVVEIVENNRKPTSCPVLFTWDGARFAYVTDCLGAGALGEEGADGSVRPPRPEEAVKIEPYQLALRNGKYVLKLMEPMDEVLYLDKLRLDVIDHPAGVAVYPDERFVTSGPQPSGELLAFAERVHPTAKDHHGRDVTAALATRDRVAAAGFAVRSWLGYAEEHWVELDFKASGGREPAVEAPETAGSRRPLAKTYLILAGWTEYPYPESIFAATQAGVAMIPPTLEQKQPDGAWKNLGEIGFPAGLTRVMTADVTGRFDPAGGPVRIRTNLQIFWDEIYLAATIPTPNVVSLPVAHATLAYRGFPQEITPGGRPPIEYDYDRLETASVTPWVGRLTRTGDVTELLTATDDQLAIAGPGDEITASFEATHLPPVPAGFVRSFVLRTNGYCKDTAQTTLTGGRVGPVPVRGLAYPTAKLPPAVAEYDAKWNTRPAAGGPR